MVCFFFLSKSLWKQYLFSSSTGGVWIAKHLMPTKSRWRTWDRWMIDINSFNAMRCNGMHTVREWNLSKLSWVHLKSEWMNDDDTVVLTGSKMNEPTNLWKCNKINWYSPWASRWIATLILSTAKYSRFRRKKKNEKKTEKTKKNVQKFNLDLCATFIDTLFSPTIGDWHYLHI